MTTMTQTEHPARTERTARSGPSDRPGLGTRLISGRLVLLLMSSFAALTSFYLLLSVTPMYAVSADAGRCLAVGGAGWARPGRVAGLRHPPQTPPEYRLPAPSTAT